MPLYEYQCERCGDQFEVIQRFSDEPLSTHEKCGGKVHRLLSAPALQFKGSGWYITDYAKRSDTSSDGPAKKDTPAATTSSESGAQSSPAASSTSDTKSGSSSDKT